MRKLRPAALILSLGIFLAACNTVWQAPQTPVETHYLRRALANAGVIRVSPDNPYIDPNRLLAFEAEKSSVLQGFLEHRGQPNALELEQGQSRAAKLRLYYKDRMEMFQLREIEDQWSIRGPFRITAAKTRALLRPSEKALVEPALKASELSTTPPIATLPSISRVEEPVEEKDERTEAILSTSTTEQEASEQIERAAVVPKKPTELHREDIPDLGAEVEASSTSPFPGSDTPLQGSVPPSAPPLEKRTLANLEAPKKNSLPPAANTAAEEKIDQSDAATEDASEKENAEGDVEHTVRYSGETLRLISKWYTGTAENADRIARINKLKNPNRLRLKQVIRIPEYLLVRLEPFPKSEVYRYLKR